MTPQDLVARALRTINVIASGEQPSADQLENSRTVLAAMFDTWAANRLTIYHVARTEYPLVNAQQSYTIGVGGDFNQARPAFLQGASIMSMNNPAQPVELPIDPILTSQRWQQIVVKATSSKLPNFYYYERTFPLGTIWVWPMPLDSTVRLALYAREALTGMPVLTTDYTFPEGYEEAILYNFCVRLAVEFGRKLDPQIMAYAREGMGNIKRINAQDPAELLFDPALVTTTRRSGVFDWRTG